eukprot:TRINITY_DN133_c0_g2_i3.p1 TRINITY_DN133_c0_g2~~TRINITY_DN133_c0_g2_i3.p1  ORF type:complete len:220 (+),score=53.52 TRINITY_DN133_c0_g2_i3:80-739(+)
MGETSIYYSRDASSELRKIASNLDRVRLVASSDRDAAEFVAAKNGVVFISEFDLTNSSPEELMPKLLSTKQAKYTSSIALVFHNHHHSAAFHHLQVHAALQDISVIPVSDVEEAARYLGILARQGDFLSKEPQAAAIINTVSAAPVSHSSMAPSLDDAAINALSSIPSISAPSAKKLLAQFKCIGAVVNADEQKLAQIKGMGAQKAKQIRSFLKGQSDS